MTIIIPQRWLNELKNNPDSDLSVRIRKSGVLQKQNTLNTKETKDKASYVSTIGNRLMSIFNNRVGAVPCGTCKATITRLNKLTPQQVIEQRDSIVAEIENNSKNAETNFITAVLSRTDEFVTGGLTKRIVIGMWLDEAVNGEIECEKQKDQSTG